MWNLSKKTLIVGVGNPFRHDDGIGSKVIELLQANQTINADLLDGGIDGLALIDVIANYESAIIIDAVNMSATLGTVKVFTPEEARLKIHSDTLSTHGFGIAEVIRLMHEFGMNTQLKIICIQPADISFGEGLSEVVTQKIPEILALCQTLACQNFS